MPKKAKANISPKALKPGRPQGAKTKQRDHAAGELTRCVKCGSTERTPYTNRQVIESAGKPYTRIILHNTSCMACSQARIDRHYENRPSRKNAA